MALLEVASLAVDYGKLRVIDDVSFVVEKGETLGLVGESGCGKSTLGKAVLRLVQHRAGKVSLDNTDITNLTQKQMVPFRKRMQMIHQDPFASLNPRHTIRDILYAPLAVHGIGNRKARHGMIEELMDRVGLPRRALGNYPHQFSGGQRQRIGIARALLLNPDLIICDEPVSALDLSVQAQILNLLVDLKGRFGLSYLFISHDLSVVRYFSDRVIVMYLGKIVEIATGNALWDNPKHPYTQMLISSVPLAGSGRKAVSANGELPKLTDVPTGCRFRTRCPRASQICVDQVPALRSDAPNHDFACHHPLV